MFNAWYESQTGKPPMPQDCIIILYLFIQKYIKLYNIRGGKMKISLNQNI